MHPTARITRLIAALFIASFLPSVQAGMVVNGTRFIYPAKQQEISVRVSNDGTEPSLVQAWIDRGDPSSKPDQADAPFLLTPPIFRLDPGKGQSLRLAFTGEALPTDRETVFWLNLLDVPPQPAADSGNSMQFAIRTRLKLFYRPSGLPGSASGAAQQISWRLVQNGAQSVLRASNPSAFHVSFSDVSLNVGGRAHQAGDGMVPPLGSRDFPLPGAVQRGAAATVVTKWINDYGSSIGHEARLEP